MCWEHSPPGRDLGSRGPRSSPVRPPVSRRPAGARPPLGRSSWATTSSQVTGTRHWAARPSASSGFPPPLQQLDLHLSSRRPSYWRLRFLLRWPETSSRAFHYRSPELASHWETQASQHSSAAAPSTFGNFQGPTHFSGFRASNKPWGRGTQTEIESSSSWYFKFGGRAGKEGES